MNSTKELSIPARRKVRANFSGGLSLAADFLLVAVFLVAGGHFVVMTNLFLSRLRIA
jgi:hypothetical protein